MKFSRLFSAPSQRRPATARGERIYAIGDVHGRLDLLDQMFAAIDAHVATLPPAATSHVVLLGDLIDRGPQSAQVLKYVQRIQQRSDKLLVLKGNHEDIMVRAIDAEPGMLKAWLRLGGSETLRSFGIEPPEHPEEMMTATRALSAAVPRDLVDWMRRMPLSARSGDYFFCHAGVRPGVPIKRQNGDDLLWIRSEFLDDESDHGAVVVHGHSIAAEVEMRHNRIGLDTGAYRTGVLTGIYLEGTEREILSVGSRDEVAAQDKPTASRRDTEHSAPNAV